MHSMIFLFVLAFVSYALGLEGAGKACVHAGQSWACLVKQLPGLSGDLPFPVWSGFLQGTGTEELFFVFVEQQDQASAEPTAPVVWWLNGGPAASSLIGLFTENGPFRVTPAGTLAKNPYAWNTAANVLYVESPAGVGFSRNPPAQSDDATMARTSYAALLSFYQLLEQIRAPLAKSPFWLAGESYAGHYIPYIAQQIVGNSSSINPLFQGFLLGNALTDHYHDVNGAISNLWRQYLITDKVYKEVLAVCGEFGFWPIETAACKKVYKDLIAPSVGSINMYDLYAPVCTGSAVGHVGGGAPLVGIGSDPCIQQFLVAYLNRLDVQRTLLHSNQSAPVIWREVGRFPHGSVHYRDETASMLPVYHWLWGKNPNLRILVYSGDVDTVIPTSGTLSWITSLDLPPVSPLRPWYMTSSSRISGAAAVGDETLKTSVVGGRWQSFQTGPQTVLTFTTVSGAGHLVPYYKPKAALHMFQSFISNKPF